MEFLIQPIKKFMDYARISFSDLSPEKKEMLIAALSVIDISGMEELGQSLVVYCPLGAARTEDAVTAIGRSLGLEGDCSRLPDQNWNQEWEKNFQPIYIDDFCCIRADFHPPAVGVRHDIIITPKMSFGTGHHATTELMIREMQQVPISGRSVLDFGTGTGILAILADMLGAASILAIDYDDWSVENAAENISRNRASVALLKGSLEVVPSCDHFDVILANINRNIILEKMSLFPRLLKPGGHVLVSGILAEDEEAIVAAAHKESFKLLKVVTRKGWKMLLLGR